METRETRNSGENEENEKYALLRQRREKRKRRSKVRQAVAVAMKWRRVMKRWKIPGECKEKQ